MNKQVIFPRPNPNNLPLSNISHYKFINSLGKGNYGTVARYMHIQSNIQYAIKIIHHKEFNPKEILMIQKQIEMLYKVKSEFIVSIRDHFQDKQNVYLITQFINGKDLYKSSFEPKKLFPLQIVAKIIYQICFALQQLYRNYIVHRDLKLENVVLSNGNIKIVDFGCSNQFGDHINRYTAIGTKPYWCPQLLNGQKQDDRLDVWCLGVLLFQLVTLQSPFTDPDMFGKIKSLKYSIPENISKESQLVSLIKSTLTYKKDRLHAHQVRKHPFIKKYYAIEEENNLAFENHFDHPTVQQYRGQLLQIIENYKKNIQILRDGNEQLEIAIAQNKKQISKYKI